MRRYALWLDFEGEVIHFEAENDAEALRIAFEICPDDDAWQLEIEEIR